MIHVHFCILKLFLILTTSRLKSKLIAYKMLRLATTTTGIASRRIDPIRKTAYISSMNHNNFDKLSDAINHDHLELQEYYREMTKSGMNADHIERYQNQFVWELARHSIGEELVVYPAFEKYLGKEGKEMADKDRNEHQMGSHGDRVETSD